jgi:hypothetical protein
VRNSARNLSALVLAVLLAQMMACASNNGTLKNIALEPASVTGTRLVAAGFRRGMGAGDWYYPGNAYPHIHINAIGTHTYPTLPKPVKFISINPGTGGQNLRPCPPDSHGVYEYNLNTPGINWGGYNAQFKGVLDRLWVAQDC